MVGRERESGGKRKIERDGKRKIKGEVGRER